jgi:hypothetical protein
MQKIILYVQTWIISANECRFSVAINILHSINKRTRLWLYCIVMRINMDRHNVLNGKSSYWCSNLDYICKWRALSSCNPHPSFDIGKQRNSTLSGKWRRRRKVVQSMYRQEGSRASFSSTDWKSEEKDNEWLSFEKWLIKKNLSHVCLV